jgi:hypothetical protein
MEDKEQRKSLAERIDEHNRVRSAKTDEGLSGQTSMTADENLSETGNAVSSPEGDKAAENKVATSLDGE